MNYFYGNVEVSDSKSMRRILDKRFSRLDKKEGYQKYKNNNSF